MLNCVLEKGSANYKASFKFENDNIDKETIFDNKKALLAISVGQPYHENGKLMATINLLNRHSFAQCDIVVGDTLQRYNYYGKMSEEEALSYCYQQGEDWLNRNSSSLAKLKIPHSIIRWNELLIHENYEKYKNKIVKAYHNEYHYKSALHSNVERYIERLKDLNPELEQDVLFSFGLGYLLEETPIIMPLWAEMGYDYIVYPKPLTVGMAKTRELFVEGKFEDKCQWVSLRFKKKSQDMSTNV